MMLPHLAAHLYGVPLLIYRPKLDLILAVLGERVMQPSGFLPEWAKPGRVAIDAPAGVAVIDIRGTLVRRTMGLETTSGLMSYAAIHDQIDAALTDPTIEGVFLDIDSPGGEASGVFDLADHIHAARQIKPIWAMADDMAFSAAYAIASAADQVWVSRTGGVGSIGVIALHVDQSAKDSQDGLTFTPVFAGARKNDLTPHAPLSESAQSQLQAEVDRLYTLFVTTVARNRGSSEEAIRATEAGLFHGPDAVAADLADQVGSRFEALQQFTRFLAGRKPLGLGNRIALSQPQEMFMSDDSPQPPVASMGDPNSFDNTMANHTAAIEIAELCTLAGYPERIRAFLEAGINPEQVRHALLEAKANRSPEVLSLLDGTHVPDQAASPTHNPLIAAVQRIAQRHAAQRKE